MTAVKHNLKHNGAPYGDDAELINEDPKVTSGPGRALCTCGEISEELLTGGQRRAWHKEHKAQAADKVTELDATLWDEATAAPQQEVAEALAELVEPAPAPKAKKVSTRRKAEQAAGFMPELDAALVVVPFTGMAKHFWFQLGRPAAKALAEKYPDLQVAHDDKARTVTVSGEQGQAQLAAAELAATWAAAPEVFAAWKRDNVAYRALKHTVVEDRRTSYLLTSTFLGDFAREQLLGK